MGTHEVYVTASIGITIYPFDSEDIDDLLKYADTAMYQAKDKGRNSYQFYQQPIDLKVTTYVYKFDLKEKAPLF